MVLCNYFKSFDGYEVTYSTANEVKIIFHFNNWLSIKASYEIVPF